ncbi:MAG: glycoside hydrolase family 15 protein [Coriobacteriia bacterium]|nr:glycoside hydrolase family 15 protein [Coriobacteriia bacterium]
MDIGDLAFLSDCQTAALVTRDGSVDWYCPPRFDAPSVFARLLDPAGGHWSLRPAGPSRVERAYVGETLVLRTVHHVPEGAVEVLEALALGPGRGHLIGMRAPHLLLRVARGLTGRVPMLSRFEPALEYALTHPRLEPSEDGARAGAGPAELILRSPVPLEVGPAKAEAAFELNAGETAAFSLAYRHAYDGDATRPAGDPRAALDDTREAWESWSAQHRTYDGLHPDRVKRSALVLQGLTYQPSGAVVAAATTSLPEVLGGDRNWDYRFAWLRDAALMMRALWVAACPDEPQRFFDFIDRAGGRLGTDVQIMYGVAGERDLSERELPHLVGFRGNGPVRAGNSAWRQRQFDVLGEVLDTAHLLQERLGTFDERLAGLLRAYADRAAEDWRSPDAGMWEARDRERHYLSSKVMCWVALDRAVALVGRLHGSESDARRWAEARDAVRETVLREGWHEERGAFTGAFGSDRLDASVLLMPLVGFIEAGDPRMRATIEAIALELGADGLVRRWAEEENGFLVCSFWLAECLALAGDERRARERFERGCAYANDLGLFAEMGEPATGMALGNYPQALSHVGLINAAWAATLKVREGRGREGGDEGPTRRESGDG